VGVYRFRRAAGLVVVTQVVTTGICELLLLKSPGPSLGSANVPKGTSSQQNKRLGSLPPFCLSPLPGVSLPCSHLRIQEGWD
jgi:hypothetical protein